LPRHTFRFPHDVRESVKRYVASRVAAVDPRRFRQEPPYCSALAQSLTGIAYEGSEGFVRFDATSIDDRGRNSAESFSGADLAITAAISNSVDRIDKAILIQAKLGSVEEMNPTRLAELKDQVRKMKKLTPSPKVMEIIEIGKLREPRILSGTNLLNDHSYVSEAIGDYMVRRVLTTLDRNTKPGFVAAVQDSSLAQLRVTAFSSL
jgi:hypothetical protein